MGRVSKERRLSWYMAVVYIVLGLGFGFRRICLDVWLF